MPVNNISLTMPNEYTAEAEAIARRRRLAEAMQAQSMQPIERFSSGGIEAPISWTQGLAKMLQAYSANKGHEAATAEQKALAARFRTEGQADVGKFMGALQGTPASSENIIDEQANDGMGAPATINAPAVPGDRQKALAIALQSQNPMVHGAGSSLLSQLLKGPEYKDLGGSIGVFQNGQQVATIPKTATADTMLKEGGLDRRFAGVSGNTAATVNAANARHLTPSGSAVLGANTTMRGQNMTDARAVEALGQGKIPPGYRATAGGGLEAIPGGPADEKEAKKTGEVKKVLDMYVAAREGLLGGLAGTSTGPVAGRVPAVTTGQQVAEGGVAAMAPVLKQLFRVSGEGVFTDRDQQLLLDMVPKRTDLPAARAEKIANIDAIVSAKLGQNIPASALAGETRKEQKAAGAGQFKVLGVEAP